MDPAFSKWNEFSSDRLLGRDLMNFAPRLWGETGLICRGLYTRLPASNSILAEQTRAGGGQRQRLISSVWLVSKYVRWAIGNAGRRLARGGDCPP